jgi:hypothetical protein
MLGCSHLQRLVDCTFGYLRCRGGDILRGLRDHNASLYICYGDIEIRYKAPTGRSINDLLAVFTIRNEKGKSYACLSITAHLP